MLRAAALTSCLAAAASTAASAAELEPGDAPIPLEEWRAMTEGRTVWYSLNGVHWGKEYFHPGGQTATFVGAEGLCATAPWVFADDLYCFSYTGLDCFRHVRRDGVLMALPLSDGAAQTIERITAEPLSCEPPLSS